MAQIPNQMKPPAHLRQSREAWKSSSQAWAKIAKEESAELEALRIENARLLKDNLTLAALRTELGQILSTSGNVVECYTPDDLDACDPGSEHMSLELSARSIDAPRLRELVRLSNYRRQVPGVKAGRSVSL